MMKTNEKTTEKVTCEDGICESEANPIANRKEEPKENDRMKLIYVGDPMCSWCWGITNHLDRIKEEYADAMDFELVLGGLRPGGGEEWTPEFREMIKTHWEHVEQASGQPFDYAFFEREEFNYDTEPPARAVRVVRDMAPEKEWAFYKRLQSMFYAENRNIDDLSELEKVCSELGIDFQKFEDSFLSSSYKRLVNQDFMKAQQMGVRGFPAVVLKKGNEYFAVTLGYSDYDRMKESMEKILA